MTDFQDDAEMPLTSSGRRRQPNNDDPPQRRGLRGLGGGQRRNNTGNNRNAHGEEQRRIRKWGPRGVMRRIRGQGIPGQEGEKPEGESLLTGDGDDGFYDNDPYGEMDYDEEESRPITDMGGDDEDDFLDPEEYIDYSQNDEELDDEEVCGDGDDDDHDDDDDSGSEEEEEDGDDGDDVGNEQTENREGGEYGGYDDEYGDQPIGNSGYRDGGRSNRDGDGGGGGRAYRDGDGDNNQGGYGDREYREYRGGFGSDPNYGRRQSRNGPRNVVLRQLNKIRRSGRRGRGRDRNSSSNLDHTNLVDSRSSDPYWNSNADVSGRIEGFGSKPDVEHHRNLREILKNFRDKRIAARSGEAGMQRMSMSGDPQRGKGWIERIDNAIDSLADAALTHPGFDGYMTSSSRTITQRPKGSTDSGVRNQSYLRTQFGDDNAYIIYLEGERVATEMEVIAYKNRIKELECEIRKLKGIEDGGESDSSNSDSSADSDSSNEGVTDEKESEIEWQTGVPEEGVLIDIEGTKTAPSTKDPDHATVPTADLLETSPEAEIQEKPAETAAPTADLLGTSIPETPAETAAPIADLLESSISETPVGTNFAPSGIPSAEKIKEKAPEAKTKVPTEQTEGVLVDLNVREEAKDIVDSILADLLSERKVTSLLQSDDEEEIKDSLLTMKLEPSVDQTDGIAAELTTDAVLSVQEETSSAPIDLLPEPPKDAPPLPPPDDPPEPPADDLPETPVDSPPQPPADTPPEDGADSEEVPTAGESEEAEPPMDDAPESPVDLPPEPPTDTPPEDDSEEAPTAGEIEEEDATKDEISTEEIQVRLEE